MSISKQEFYDRLAEALDEDRSLIDDATVLDCLASWDSLGHISTIALMDELFHTTVDADALRRCRTVKDLLDLVPAGVTS